MATGAAISAAEFSRFMAPLGPFEPKPQVAVAVSGGPDSLALALLMHRWAAGRRGKAVALTVDHGLRPESSAEARQVGRWLKSYAIEHRILRWRPGTVSSRLQAQARAARYRLLSKWCRDHGVINLALGHHRDDQAETLMLRLARGSGLDGLAAMPKVSETADLRLIRPLLDCPGQRLRDFLIARGQAWIDDPSNTNDRFARSRVRAALDANQGGTAELALSSRRLGYARAALEAATAALLASAVAPHPAGFCAVDIEQLRAAPAELALRALARVLMCVGGEPYPPRRDRLERFFANLLAAETRGAARTLAGCLVIPRGTELQVVRETRGVAGPCDIEPGENLLWDGRFSLSSSRRMGHLTGKQRVRVAAIGAEGWRAVRTDLAAGDRLCPRDAALTLPGLWDEKGLRAVPQLGYERESTAVRWVRVAFRPAQPLAAATFPVV